MTEQFEKWFDKNFPRHMWNCEGEGEREEVKVYTWLAWRDALRQNSEE